MSNRRTVFLPASGAATLSVLPESETRTRGSAAATPAIATVDEDTAPEDNASLEDDLTLRLEF